MRAHPRARACLHARASPFVRARPYAITRLRGRTHPCVRAIHVLVLVCATSREARPRVSPSLWARPRGLTIPVRSSSRLAIPVCSSWWAHHPGVPDLV